MISDHGWQVLSKSDDVANWANFWAFLTTASSVAQIFLESSNVDAIKDQLLKAGESLNSILQANTKLAGDNKNLEDRMHALTIEAKGLKMRVVNVEALVRT